MHTTRKVYNVWLSCCSTGPRMEVVLGAGGFRPRACKCRCSLLLHAVVGEVGIIVAAKVTESVLDVCVVGRP